MEGGFRVPAIIKWPGKVAAGKVENGIMSGLDWFPTFVAAAGDPNIAAELKQGKKIGDTTYKVYLDGYDQTPMLTGKGPSNRHEIFYFGESTLGAVRIDDFKYRFIDQPNGWLGAKVTVDVPYLTNLRLDPFERTGWPDGPDRRTDRTSTSSGSSSSSGALSSFSSRSPSWRRPRSSFRRCSAARASTSMRSRRRSKRRGRRWRSDVATKRRGVGAQTDTRRRLRRRQLLDSPCGRPERAARFIY